MISPVTRLMDPRRLLETMLGITAIWAPTTSAEVRPRGSGYRVLARVQHHGNWLA